MNASDQIAMSAVGVQLLPEYVVLDTVERFRWAAKYALGGVEAAELMLTGRDGAACLHFDKIANHAAPCLEGRVAEATLGRLVDWVNVAQGESPGKFALCLPPVPAVLTNVRVDLILLDTQLQPRRTERQVVNHLQHRAHIVIVEAPRRSYAGLYLSGARRRLELLGDVPDAIFPT